MDAAKGLVVIHATTSGIGYRRDVLDRGKRIHFQRGTIT
jgi:hypothetical protein